MQKANAPLLRKVNQSRIRQALWKLREATKYQLAQETGLSQMTVNNVLAGLQENGEAEEEGRMPSEGGRPSTLYRYRGSYGHALALYSFQDRGRSLVRLHVIDLLGTAFIRTTPGSIYSSRIALEKCWKRHSRLLPGFG